MMSIMPYMRWLLLIITLILLNSATAYAVPLANQPPRNAPPGPIDACFEHAPPSFDSWAYTQPVVSCIDYTIRIATYDMLNIISDYMRPVTGIMFVFATVMLGMRIVSGERDLPRRAVGFALRAGLVAMFSFNLYGWSNVIFGITDQLLNLVVGDIYTPWQKIDIFMGKLVGAGPNLLLSSGLIGILAGALLSSTVGIMLAVAGFLAIIDILTFILRAVFTYLVAILLIGFMLIISPIIIPLTLFFYTERYFRKWIDMLIAAMLTPMLLFAFLQLFLGVFNVLIASIFGTLGFPCPACVGPFDCDLTACRIPNFSSFWRINQPFFSWLMPGDSNLDQMLTAITNGNISDPAVQSNINPLLRRGFENNLLNMPGIDFGLNNIGMMQQLVFQFISLWVFASLMKTLAEKIPEVAASISGTVSGLNLQAVSFRQMASETFGNFVIGSVNTGAHLLGRIGSNARPAAGAVNSISRRV